LAPLSSDIAFQCREHRFQQRPVLDKTGFTGEFDIDLNYTDEEVTLALSRH
jgi:uncharacterized protein (TIGR03435 family)